MPEESSLIIIKKYPNRRLYNTNISDYITLADVRKLVLDGYDFIVKDAKSGIDLTRITLAQIIFEQENTGSYLLNTNFLRQLIVFYDDNLINILPQYLELTMKSFNQHQDNLRNMTSPIESITPISIIEKITENNINIFEKTMKMFFNK
jgi:polyhydroxyalkanoate synthesis repressor PhaR